MCAALGQAEVSLPMDNQPVGVCYSLITILHLFHRTFMRGNCATHSAQFHTSSHASHESEPLQWVLRRHTHTHTHMHRHLHVHTHTHTHTLNCVSLDLTPDHYRPQTRGSNVRMSLYNQHGGLWPLLLTLHSLHTSSNKPVMKVS